MYSYCRFPQLRPKHSFLLASRLRYTLRNRILRRLRRLRGKYGLSRRCRRSLPNRQRISKTHMPHLCTRLPMYPRTPFPLYPRRFRQARARRRKRDRLRNPHNRRPAECSCRCGCPSRRSRGYGILPLSSTPICRLPWRKSFRRKPWFPTRDCFRRRCSSHRVRDMRETYFPRNRI